jgi:hypothetical protein
MNGILICHHLAYRQYTSAMAGTVYDGGDIVQQILSEGEDYYDQWYCISC